MVGDKPSDDDVLFGLVDSAELADPVSAVTIISPSSSSIRGRTSDAVVLPAMSDIITLGLSITALGVSLESLGWNVQQWRLNGGRVSAELVRIRPERVESGEPDERAVLVRNKGRAPVRIDLVQVVDHYGDAGVGVRAMEPEPPLTLDAGHSQMFRFADHDAGLVDAANRVYITLGTGRVHVWERRAQARSL